MLTITIPASELYDERTNTFVYIEKETTLKLEHSLVSLAKWESKWCKPYISKKPKTNEETLDYIKCMTITQNVNPNVYLGLTDNNYKQIRDYIDAPMTASTVSEDASGKKSNKTITSELIYCWMFQLNIPLECQKWHVNRLITLIKVCSAENQPPKKKSRANAAKEYAALNAARRKQLNTKG